MPPRHVSSPLLVAEDNANDMFLFTRLLKSAGSINALHIALDGLEAIRLLTPIVEKNRLAARPAVAFLHVHLPRLSGLDVLKWIRERPALDELPVVMLSTSSHRGEVQRAAELGAQCFLLKYPAKHTIARVLELAERFTARDSAEFFDLPDNLLR